MITLYCSNTAFHTFLSLDIQNKELVYGCNFDLSYGNLNKKKSFLSSKKICSKSKFLNIINEQLNIEIWYNSNNACEYCNLLFLIYLLSKKTINIFLVDTGIAFHKEMYTIESTSTDNFDMNCFNDLKKIPLSKATKELFLNEWNLLLNINSELRYCEKKKIYSVEESYFDQLIFDNDILSLCTIYGLSEEWINYRNKTINIISKI